MTTDDSAPTREAESRSGMNDGPLSAEAKARYNETYGLPAGACNCHHGSARYCPVHTQATLDAARSQPVASEGLREALTDVQFAQRHLLGDSDVTREDASVSLTEAERNLRAVLASQPDGSGPARQMVASESVVSDLAGRVWEAAGTLNAAAVAYDGPQDPMADAINDLLSVANALRRLTNPDPTDRHDHNVHHHKACPVLTCGYQPDLFATPDRRPGMDDSRADS